MADELQPIYVVLDGRLLATVDPDHRATALHHLLGAMRRRGETHRDERHALFLAGRRLGVFVPLSSAMSSPVTRIQLRSRLNASAVVAELETTIGRDRKVIEGEGFVLRPPVIVLALVADDDGEAVHAGCRKMREAHVLCFDEGTDARSVASRGVGSGWEAALGVEAFLAGRWELDELLQVATHPG